MNYVLIVREVYVDVPAAAIAISNHDEAGKAIRENFTNIVELEGDGFYADALGYYGEQTEYMYDVLDLKNLQ